MAAALDAWPLGAGGWVGQPDEPVEPPLSPTTDEPEQPIPDGYEPI